MAKKRFQLSTLPPEDNTPPTPSYEPDTSKITAWEDEIKALTKKRVEILDVANKAVKEAKLKEVECRREAGMLLGTIRGIERKITAERNKLNNDKIQEIEQAIRNSKEAEYKKLLEQDIAKEVQKKIDDLKKAS